METIEITAVDLDLLLADTDRQNPLERYIEKQGVSQQPNDIYTPYQQKNGFGGTSSQMNNPLLMKGNYGQEKPAYPSNFDNSRSQNMPFSPNPPPAGTNGHLGMGMNMGLGGFGGQNPAYSHNPQKSTGYQNNASPFNLSAPNGSSARASPLQYNFS